MERNSYVPEPRIASYYHYVKHKSAIRQATGSGPAAPLHKASNVFCKRKNENV